MDQTFYPGQLKQHKEFGGYLYIIKENDKTVECRYLTSTDELIRTEFEKTELEDYVE